MGIHDYRVPVMLGSLSLLLLAGSARAADSVRIAVVDARRALISSQEGRAAEKVLQELMEQRREQIRPLRPS